MNLKALAAAVIFTASSTAAFAGEPTAAKADAKAQPAATQAADADRMVCKQERPVGSLIPTRVCKTAAQWENEREQSRQMMQNMQQRTGSTSSR